MAVVLYNAHAEGASTEELNRMATFLGLSDSAAAPIWNGAAKRLRSGRDELRTRRAVIDYAYGLCMDGTLPATGAEPPTGRA